MLFTNVCHCHAVYCVSKLFEQLNNKNTQQKYTELHKKIKKKLIMIFGQENIILIGLMEINNIIIFQLMEIS